MKVFHCQHCGHLLFFENSRCVSCGYRVVFIPESRTLTSIPVDDTLTNAPATPATDATALPAPSPGTAMPPATPAAPLHATAADTPSLRRCRNDVEYDVCNWAVAADDPQPLCQSCRLTRVIPDASRPDQRLAWYKLETAKRRLVFTLLGLRLPVVNREQDPNNGLAFEFLADPDDSAAPRIMTGHASGLIVVNIAEADDAEREKRRQGLGEPFRTLLGHMRHESGHYYWDRLIRDGVELKPFRELFGDESVDYAGALAGHYQQGPPPDWQSRFVTAYASAHPWEDWAETWAHYLHMVDALETAADNGLVLKPRRDDEPSLRKLSPDVTSGRVPFDRLIESWFPLTYVLNNLNRGLGLADGYPFVLSTPAIDKLRFVHDVIGRWSTRAEPVPATAGVPATTG